MQGLANQECHFHYGERIIAYCTLQSCHASTGRCKICLNMLDNLGCNSAHITNSNELPYYFKNQLQELISYLTKLLANTYWIEEVQKSIVLKYTEQIKSYEELNRSILKNIEYLKLVKIEDLCDKKIKNISTLIEIKNDIHLSINKSTMMEMNDHKNFQNEIDNLNDFNSMLVKLQSSYVQNIISKRFVNIGEEPLRMNHNIEAILNSRRIIIQEIQQQETKMSSHLKLYPEFQEKQQQITNLLQQQKFDLALSLSLQMMEKYKEDIIYQSEIFSQICQICKLDQKYFTKYRKISCEYRNEEDKLNRMLSEHNFDLKNYSQSLYYLLQVKQQLGKQTSGLYFAQIRFAQIYLKLKDKDKLRLQLNQISIRLNQDSYLNYLKAKLAILEDREQFQIIHYFEQSINKQNAHPIAYLKYIKYLKQVQNYEKAQQIYQRYQQKKFMINSDHKEANISQLNYLVDLI